MSCNWFSIRFWLLVSILAALPAGGPALAQGSTVVRVEPAALTVQVNDAVNISVKVDNITNLSAFELHLSFNPNVLEVTGITNGGFILADFTAQNTFDNAAGTIDYAIAQMNRPPAQGSGTLLNIAFRAKANGSSTVTTRATPAAPSGLLLSDQNGIAIQASWSPGTITVGSALLTDTPTSTSSFTSIPNTPINTSTPLPITNTPSLAGTPTLAQNAAVVRVEPSTLSAQVGDTINISIKVDNIANLTAFELHLSFIPGVLEVTSVTNGGFVAADFIVQDERNNSVGTIDYAVAQKNRSPAQGSGTLLNIALRAKAIGCSTVTTRATQAAPSGLILSDQNGMAIQASWVPGTICVKSTDTLGTHVVRWGEWLYCIGRAYKVSPWAIAKTNGIWWPNIIFPNQKLTIPNVPWTNIPPGRVCNAQFTVPTSTPIPTTPVPTSTPVTATSTPVTSTVTPAPATTTAPASCRAVYVVRSGDTLYNIALRYGTSYAEIARVNQISNPRLIYPGQQLCIP